MRDLPHPITIKTSPPSLVGVIERPRLVSALAQLSANAKWLQSPSGTGKSTLAASYAHSLKKQIVWYRLDERDNDPAFFYAEFAQTVRTQLRLTKQLPKFSSDDHNRQEDFAQRFASALREQLKKPALIVLDDLQCITHEEMQRALAAVIAAAVNGNEFLLVSQSVAPTAFFDAIAARQLSLLNDADLRFDVDECKAMIGALRIAGTHSESIAALTGGHAGALVLACELLRDTDPKSALGVATAERIHLHLLTKLIDRMPQARRDLLLETAFVTHLTRPIAKALAGVAAEELDHLAVSGLLRNAGRSGSDEMFEAHGLVRQGVRALVRTRLGQSKARARAVHTAEVLVDHGQPEAAFTLLAEIGSTAPALAVLKPLAERYAADGQTDLLLHSIAKLPAALVERDAWLCFWVGQALLRIDEEQARIWFGRSYAAFDAAGDAFGTRLAAASIVTVFGLECGDLRELDVWIERHTNAGGDTPIPAAHAFEASFLMGILCSALVRGCFPAQVDPAAVIARIRLLIEEEVGWLSDDQRVQAARLLIEHSRLFETFVQAQNVIVATRFLIARSSASALHRGRWLIASSYAYLLAGDTAQSTKYLSEARLIAERSKSAQLSFELGQAFANHWMKAQDFEKAAVELNALEELATRSVPAGRADYARMMARLLLLQERPAEGLRWAEEARRLAVPAGFSGANLRGFEIELVYALAANDRLAEAIDLVSQKGFEPHDARLAVEHCLRFLLSEKSDLQQLRIGLQIAREIGFLNLLDRARAPLAQICDAALANDVETEFITRLINVKQLKPPSFAGSYWPWPVHVRTLGGFQLNVQGKRYRPPRKAQDKPLELLKLLVTCQALGRGSAEKMWIAERLWPDAEAENARKSLEMTVGRLRRLLGREDTVLTNEGRLELAPTVVWTDIGALLQALSSVRAQHDEHAAGKPTADIDVAANIRVVLEHYRGPYLADEEDAPWLLAGKEAIAAAVRRALLTCDKILDGNADELLIASMERAFAVDPTSEDIARSLMRAHLREGHHSETLRVYRRLREMLSLLLGLAPSTQTDHIRDQAYAAEASKTATKPVAGVRL